jgi:hypothetical protein
VQAHLGSSSELVVGEETARELEGALYVPWRAFEVEGA